MKPYLLPVFPILTMASASASWLDGDYLTGDWNGKRTEWANSGVSFFGYYNAIGAANVSGGIEHDSSYAGDLFIGAKFDLEKLIGWDSTVFTLSGIDRHGRSIDPAVGGQHAGQVDDRDVGAGDLQAVAGHHVTRVERDAVDAHSRV